MLNKKKYWLPSLLILACSACSLPKSKETLQVVTDPSSANQARKVGHEVCEKTYQSYFSFAKKFASIGLTSTFEKEGENSLAVSIPDAYLCLSIMAAISDDDAQNDVLSYLELSSMDELRTSVREISSVLCTLFKDNYGRLRGGYNLNSLWLDPQQVRLLEEKDEALYRDLESLFCVSTFLDPLTSDKANAYLKQYGLKDLPTPEIELEGDPPALGTMSVFYCMDYFDEEAKQTYKKQYRSGNHKMDYYLPEGDAKKVDFISTTDYGNVLLGDNFVGASSSISNLTLTYFLPNEKETMPSSILQDVLERNYTLRQSSYYDPELDEDVETTTHKVSVSAPYFTLNNKISLEGDLLSSMLPVITRRGAGTRLVEPIEPLPLLLAYIKQFSTMKFNYDGFYSCSATIGGIEAGSPFIPQYERYNFILNHPYLFQVSKSARVGSNRYERLPLVIGEIVDPAYVD